MSSKSIIAASGLFCGGKAGEVAALKDFRDLRPITVNLKVTNMISNGILMIESRAVNASIAIWIFHVLILNIVGRSVWKQLGLDFFPTSPMRLDCS